MRGRSNARGGAPHFGSAAHLPARMNQNGRDDKPSRPSAAVGLSGLLLLHAGVNVGHSLADRGDLLSVLVRNLTAELFLESHNEFNQVERIRFQLFAETRLRGDLSRISAE